ncbi:MAG TPA: endonuclease domain-containing protein [Mesorhizobium sp.]|nr:endonuclease domain-containing protein [Mesorhizobium sp.]
MPNFDRFRLASAKRLRLEMTDEEHVLWRHIWRIPVEGTHFRKQARLGPYVADFLSHRLKLVIEVDGAYHDDPAQRQRDEARTQWLRDQGYRVLRFTNDQVKGDLGAVLDAIRRGVHEQLTFGVAGQGNMSGDGLSVAHPTPALARRPSPSRGG